MYLIEGLILTIFATKTSGMQGRWANDLQLPFGAVAEYIWVLVPMLFIAISIRKVRKKLGMYQHWVHIIAVACIIIPVVIFTQQTQKIALNDFPSVEAMSAIDDYCHGRILFIGTNAVIPKSLDSGDVAQKIFSLDPSVDPN